MRRSCAAAGSGRLATLRGLVAAGLVVRRRGCFVVAGAWHVETSAVRGPRVRSAPVWMRRIAELDLPGTRRGYLVFDCDRERFARLAEIWHRADRESREALQPERRAETAGVVVYAMIELAP